jgi:hypothetical protein
LAQVGYKILKVVEDKIYCFSGNKGGFDEGIAEAAVGELAGGRIEPRPPDFFSEKREYLILGI